MCLTFRDREDKSIIFMIISKHLDWLYLIEYFDYFDFYDCMIVFQITITIIFIVGRHLSDFYLSYIFLLVFVLHLAPRSCNVRLPALSALCKLNGRVRQAFFVTLLNQQCSESPTDQTLFEIVSKMFYFLLIHYSNLVF